MQTPTVRPRHGYKELVKNTLVKNDAPATALINRHHEALSISGPLVDYLEFPAGEPNQNLLAMCRLGPRTQLRVAWERSVVEEIDTKIECQLKRGADAIECTVHVRAVKTRKNAERSISEWDYK